MAIEVSLAKQLEKEGLACTEKQFHNAVLKWACGFCRQLGHDSSFCPVKAEIEMEALEIFGDAAEELIQRLECFMPPIHQFDVIPRTNPLGFSYRLDLGRKNATKRRNRNV